MTERNERKTELSATMGATERHEKKRKRRHAKRPCGGNTPNTPGTLTFSWDLDEKLRHNRIIALFNWAPVRANTSGARSTMRRYRVQLQRSDDGGTTRLGKTRKFIVPEATVRKVLQATITSGTTAQYVLDGVHDLDVGDTIVVSGMTPGGYNGTFTVSSTPADNVFRANIGVSPADATGFGDAYEDVTSVERRVRKHTWYRFRVQAENSAGCISSWSSWTAWTLANDHTAPPTPISVMIYDSATNRVVVDWEPPTLYVPIEGTVSGSGGGTTITGSGTFFNAQVGLQSRVRFGTAGDVRIVTAIASDTSLTIDSGLSGAVSAGTVLYIEVPDRAVAMYDVWVGTAPFPSTAYRRDKFHHATRYSFRPKDADLGSTFYAAVVSKDASENRSGWVQAKLDPGNSTVGVAGDGVVIGAAGGSGKTKVPWFVIGRLRELDESVTHDYDIDEGLTLTKVRVRIKNPALGQSVKITPYKNGSGLTQITLPAGASRVAEDSYATAFADADRLSFSIDQVGTTFAGKNLTVTAIFVPT